MKSKAPTKKKQPSKLQIRLDDMIVGLADAQRLIAKGETHVLMLVREGYLKKAGSGRYRVADVAQAALKFRESDDRASSQTAEAKRVQSARAVEIELRTARAAREVIPIKDVCAFLSETLGTLRSELSGVAAASARDMASRTVIDAKLNEAIDRLRKKFDGGASTLRSRRPLTEDRDDDADG